MSGWQDYKDPVITDPAWLERPAYGGDLTFDVEPCSVKEAREYAVLWNTAHKALPTLTEEQLATVIALVTGTCGYCHERPHGCQCWNDE